MTEQGHSTTICLLGASFDTGNLGVNALAESTIKVLLHKWPDAEIVLLGNGYEPAEVTLPLMGREVVLRAQPVRFSKTLSLPYHFLWYVLNGLLVRIMPGSAIKERIMNRNPYCRAVYESSLAVDITGGDSFSDIYGMRRFVLGFLRKWVVLLYGKKFVMLPQTYGPFNRRITRVLARQILGRAQTIFSRDKEGVEYLKQILNGRGTSKIQFSPDVAFVLDPRAPAELQIEPDANLRACGCTVVGLNISGLLYNGGYTRDNVFGLKVDYRALVRRVAEKLLQQDGTVLLLVPHVFPPAGMEVESDPVACRRVFEELRGKYGGRVFLAAGRYNHNEIKYIIGLCDFFLGSRMHACIAALSQGIPAVGLAYSKKFRGVFETVGMDSWVVNLQEHDESAVVDAVSKAFEQRHAAAESLKRTIPAAQEQIMKILEDV
jgi:polysaccharide pyruvyl transferase WcaK-like protein